MIFILRSCCFAQSCSKALRELNVAQLALEVCRITSQQVTPLLVEFCHSRNITAIEYWKRPPKLAR